MESFLHCASEKLTQTRQLLQSTSNRRCHRTFHKERQGVCMCKIDTKANTNVIDSDIDSKEILHSSISFLAIFPDRSNPLLFSNPALPIGDVLAIIRASQRRVSNCVFLGTVSASASGGQPDVAQRGGIVVTATAAHTRGDTGS